MSALAPAKGKITIGADDISIVERTRGRANVLQVTTWTMFLRGRANIGP